jgi:hypothetical protein
MAACRHRNPDRRLGLLDQRQHVLQPIRWPGDLGNVQRLGEPFGPHLVEPALEVEGGAWG